MKLTPTKKVMRRQRRKEKICINNDCKAGGSNGLPAKEISFSFVCFDLRFKKAPKNRLHYATIAIESNSRALLVLPAREGTWHKPHA